MAVRFRIRTSAGQELSFASHEMFEDFVRSGDLSPDDLVYDGETGSWSPARTHPTVLEIEYEREDGAAAARSGADVGERFGADEAGGDDAAAAEQAPHAEAGAQAVDASPSAPEEPPEAVPSSDDLGLDLAPIEARTPEEEAQAFLRKLEAERESEIEGAGSRRIEGFTMKDSSTLADVLQPAEREPAGHEPFPGPSAKEPIRPPAKEPIRPPARPPSRREEPVRPPEPVRRPEVRRPEPPRGHAASSEVAEKSSGSGRRLLTTVLAVAVVGGGAYAGYVLLRGAAPSPVDEPETEVEPMAVEPEPEPPPREPVIASTEAAVRERAQERFLTATQGQLRDLQPVPEAWASGSYLAVPSEHPEVVDVWQSYLATIRRVRAGDAERYRTAYLAALDDAVVEGEARGTRLAAAMAEFDASAAPRAAHWDRVEALATAALQSHNALVEAEGLILYDPAVAGDGLGAGTSGRDADAQLLLRQVIELFGARLDANGLGPRAPARVREWVWDGFLDAATR